MSFCLKKGLLHLLLCLKRKMAAVLLTKGGRLTIFNEPARVPGSLPPRADVLPINKQDL